MGKSHSAGSSLLGRNLRVSLRRARVAEIVVENPRVTERALCEAVGVGKGTIHRDKQALVGHAREAATAIQEQIRSRQTELLEEAVAIALRGLVRELFDKEGHSLGTVVDPGAAGLLVKALAHIAKLWGAYLDPDAAHRARLENPDADHFLSEDMRRRIREAREAVGSEVGS